MSQPPLTPGPSSKERGEKEAAKVSARHYQALCGLALSAIILLQLQQSTLMPQVSLAVGILLGCIGVIAIFYRSRMRPMLVLIAMAVPHVIEQYYSNLAFNPDSRGVRFLDLADVMMCIATLAYFIGHYRLHGLWFGVLPPDSRMAATPAPPRLRSEESLSATELVTLVFSVPLFALMAQFAYLLLQQQWTGIELPPRWKQFLIVAWVLLLVMFLAAHGFRYWRRLQMDRVSALLMLQDILWNETRGEQRRINRWIAWRRLTERKKKL